MKRKNKKTKWSVLQLLNNFWDATDTKEQRHNYN